MNQIELICKHVLKYKRSSLVIAATILIVGFQNCAKQVFEDDSISASAKSVGNSPFKTQKVFVTTDEGPSAQGAMSQKASVTSGAVVATVSSDSLSLAVMVNEKMRRANLCGGSASFSAQYLPASPSQAEVDSKILPLWTYQVELQKSYITGSLSDDVDHDPCVLGISNLNILKGILSNNADFQTAANVYFNAPESSSTNLQQALNSTSIASFIAAQSAALGQNRIPVAVIGTGINLNSTEFAHLATNLAGSNYVEMNSVPADDHFLGSGVASLLSAKGVLQPTVRGLVPDLIDVMPIRVMGRGSLSNDDFTNLNLQNTISRARESLAGLKATVMAGLTNLSIPQNKAQPVLDLITQVDADATAISNAMDGRFSASVRAQIAAKITAMNTILVNFGTASSVLSSDMQAQVSQVATFVQALQTFDPENPFAESVGLFLQSANQAIIVDRGIVAKSNQPAAWVNTQNTRLDNMKANLDVIETLAQAALLTQAQRAERTSSIATVATELNSLLTLVTNMGLETTQTQDLQNRIREMLASYKAAVLDQSVIRTNQLPSNVIADAIVRAVNNGAQVINLAVYGKTPSCDPILGEAIYQALKKNVVVVMPSGDDASEILSANEAINLRQETVSPACWGQYFKGALTVGSYETTSRLATGGASLAEFSNYGTPVKILAPGTSIPILDQKNQVGVWNGSLLATPQVTAAVATLIALHKTNGWDYYSPWLIEDLLMSGSDPANANSRVAQAKILNFTTLKTAIDLYQGQTDNQRRSLAGAPLLMATAPAGPVERDTLVISANESFIATNQRTQLQVQINHKVGPPDQIPMSEVVWTVSPANSAVIDANGVLTPLTAAGRITLTASARNLAASASLVITSPPSIVTDMTLECKSGALWIASSVTTTKYDPLSGQIYCRVTTIDSRGLRIDQTNQSSWSMGPYGSSNALAPINNPFNVSQMRPGKYDVRATLNGISRTFTFEMIATTYVSMSLYNWNTTYVPNGTLLTYALLTTQVGNIDIVYMGDPRVSWSYDRSIFTYQYPIYLAIRPDAKIGTYAISAQYNGPLSNNQTFSAAISATIVAQSIIHPSVLLERSGDNGKTWHRLSTDTRTPIQSLVALRNNQNVVVTVPYKIDGFTIIFDTRTLAEGTYTATALATDGASAIPVSGSFGVKKHPTLTLPSASGPLPTAIDPDNLKVTSSVCLSALNRSARPFAGGRGSSADPFLICTPEQLFAINSVSTVNYSPKVFQLMDNLDLTNFSNQMVGFVGDELNQGVDIDTFHGNGYAIRNFTYVAPNADNIALFGFVRTIDGLIILDPLVQGRTNVAILANRAYSIQDVQIMGTHGNRAVVQGAVNSSINGGTLSAVTGLSSSASSFSRILLKSVDVKGGNAYISGVALYGYLKDSVISDISVSCTAFAVSNNNYWCDGVGAQTVQNTVFSGVVSGKNYVFVNGIGGGSDRIFSSSFFGSVIGEGSSTVSGLSYSARQMDSNIFKGSIQSTSGANGLAQRFLEDSIWDNNNIVSNNIFNGSLSTSNSRSQLAILGNVYMDTCAGDSASQAFGITRGDCENYYISNNTWDSSQNSAAVLDSYDGDRQGITPIDMGNGSSVRAVIGGPSASSTIQGTMNIPITGDGVAYYRYKLASSADVGVCADQIGYYKEFPVGVPITIGKRELPDGDVVICVIGLDSQGKQQSFSQASSRRWNKLSVASPAVTLTGTPGAASGLTTLNITVSGVSAVTNYVYKLGPSLNGMCDSMTGASSERAISSKITDDISGLANGSITLCVWGKNAGGFFQSQATIFNWTKLIRPVVANLANVPFSENKTVTLGVTVSGVGVVTYKYKVGPASTTSCAAVTGYSATAIPVATLITDNISSLTDGAINLCVLGFDDIGNAQTPANATMYSWTKSTAPPIAVITGAPASPSTESQVYLSVTGNRVTSYQYKWGAGTAFSCAADTGYQTVASSLTQISLNLSTTPDGLITVCVRGVDGPGNIQPSTTATKVSWTKAQPVFASLANAPSGENNTVVLSVKVTGIRVVNYKYKVGPASTTSCATAAGYSATPIPVATLITNNISSLADGTINLCVLGFDNIGAAQALAGATMSSWTKSTTPPIAVITGTPASPSNATQVSLNITGNRMISYQYKWGPGTAFSCAGDSGYQTVAKLTSNLTTSLTQISLNLGSTADGLITVCVRGADGLGNIQSSENATKVSWTKNTTIPVTLSGSGLPSANIVSLGAASWTVSVNSSSATMTSYVYKVSASATELCDSTTGASTTQGISTPIAINASSYANGTTMTLCVWGINSFGGTYQTVATRAQFKKVALIAKSFFTQDVNSKLNTSISGTGVVSYKYKIGVMTNTDCSSATGYSAAIPISQTITDDLSDYFSAPMYLCLLGIDSTGYSQALAGASVLLFRNNSNKAYGGVIMGTAYANEVSTDSGSWAASNAVDSRASTAYRSNSFTSTSNSRSASLSAWTQNKEFYTVSQVILAATMVNGVPQYFPQSYAVYVVNPTGTGWSLVGIYSTQPNAQGQAVIRLPAPVSTNGVSITPVTLGPALGGKIYFQLAEVQLN